MRTPGRLTVAAGLLAASTLTTMGLLGDVVRAGGGTPGTASSDVDASCQYPPGIPELEHTVSSTLVKVGSTVRNEGEVEYNDCEVAGAPVGLYAASTPTGTFTKVGETVTDAEGEWVFQTVVRSTTVYKAVVLDPAVGTVESTPLTVRVK